MKACDHVSSRDNKKQVGSYFVMRAGLRNNEFCLCGLPFRNDKVVTTLAQGCHNAFLQPCHNLGTTLAQPCILKLSQGCDKVVRTLSQGCPNIVTRLPQCNLVTTLAQPCILKLSQVVTRWWQGCHKVVRTLSQGCHNVPFHNLVF